MKKLYLGIMMLAMTVAALGITACGNDEEDESNIGGKRQKTLKVDGVSLYPFDCTVQETNGNSMYFVLQMVENYNSPWSGTNHYLSLLVYGRNKVKKLSVGEELDLNVQYFRHLNEIVVNTYEWDVISGSLTVEKIGKTSIDVRFD